MKHTPSPWTAYLPSQQRPLTAKGNPSDKRLMVLHPDKERLIACLSTGCISPSKGPIPDEEREANAKLISAAPELLAALQAMVDAITPPRNEEEESAMRIARAAITKALA